jgi:predicted amidohydrolase
MTPFRVAAAQVASARGDLARNLATHAAAIQAAAARGVSVLVFPELSLTGYEPDLAATHALEPADPKLDPLAALATEHHMHVMAGAPLLVGGERPALGAVVFGPDGARAHYAKMHLGGSEARHFAPGATPLALRVRGEIVGLSICADSSRPAHPAGYAAAGAGVYVASMFLNAEWDATDRPRLPRYAAEHGMLVLLANHAASVGTYRSVGRSAAWVPGGRLLAEAADAEDALVVVTRGNGADAWSAEVVALG